MLWKALKGKYRAELLAFLRLFRGDKVVGFSYEEKGGRWVLFIHFSRCVVQISGDKSHGLKDTVYVSPIIETIY
jgi:hypothetical protein